MVGIGTYTGRASSATAGCAKVLLPFYGIRHDDGLFGEIVSVTSEFAMLIAAADADGWYGWCCSDGAEGKAKRFFSIRPGLRQ